MSCMRYLSTIAPLSSSSFVKCFTRFSLEHCLRIFLHFLIRCFLFSKTVWRLARDNSNSDPCCLVSLHFWGWFGCGTFAMQSSHASANGGVGGRRATVSSWCRWCHSRVILRVHALSIHRCHSRVILSSRVILGCPVIRLPLMSESYECTNATHRSILWCDLYMVSKVW